MSETISDWPRNDDDFRKSSLDTTARRLKIEDAVERIERYIFGGGGGGGGPFLAQNGSTPLTGDWNFGSFNIASPSSTNYVSSAWFQSNGTISGGGPVVSSTGTIRLNRLDQIAWRNFTNTGNVILAPNGTSQLTLNSDFVVGGDLIAYQGKAQAATFQTSAAFPAQSGTMQLAHGDTVVWRNRAGDGDLTLGVNAADQLTFNGVPIS